MCRCLCLLLLAALPVGADDATAALSEALREYATAELAKVPGKDGKYSTALPDYLRDRIAAANRRDREAWGKVTSREEWVAFRDERINALRASLGTWPEAPKSVPTRVTKTIDGAGYRIDNLLYESRPGAWVTGNLYYADRPGGKRPVILIAHSHHAPKGQGELQDMGVTWAKLGCLVLVIDQLGHGERRQHPFADARAYPQPFRVSRQDYYFRYNLNLQLSLVGDSLMGWMAWDLMRGLDVVLARPGADKGRVILFGAVAGGGDVAAVTAALDPRFQCVVPFNFGGPQPETRYPLPETAEEWFNYAGSGSWESTRNLRDSAAKGFLPWAIVASVAPRKVIHAHEFSWDRDRDPVWKRYQKVWGFYGAADNLAFTHGTGVIQGNDPTASHCTNIGPIQRKGIYAAIQKWFDIPIPAKESSERRPAEELRCWTDEARKELKPRPLHEVLAEMADRQRGEWPPHTTVFDAVNGSFRLVVEDELSRTQQWPQLRLPGSRGCEAYHWPAGRPSSAARALMFKPRGLAEGERIPLVCCLTQGGAHSFLAARSQAVAALLAAKVAVLLVNWQSTGLDRPGEGRGRSSWTASLASTAEMVGTPLGASRINDTRNALSRALRDFSAVLDLERALIWGESLSEPNGPDEPVEVPHDVGQPRLAEPLAATLASLLGLNRSQVRVKAVIARGGLVSYRSVLDSPFVHVPHDTLPVNVFRAGDLPDVWAHLAPKPLRLEGLVDGTNRRVTGERLESALRPVAEAYKKGGLVVKEDYTPDAELAKWVIEQLKR